jgi:glycosyltransferase involved in cell wall biosynthesis
MPAYNAGNYVLQSVNSIINQSYNNWELIIVNDGSTDNTAKQLDGITDSRVRIYQQENKGQCAAANKAFGFSSGSFVKFMDADDLISEDTLKLQVQQLRSTTNAIAYTSWGRFYDDDLGTFKLDTAFITGDAKPFNWLIASMTNKEVMLQCALWLIPTSLLNKSGLWNENLSLINDFEFFIRVLLNADELKFTPGAMLYYRSGVRNSLSSTKSEFAAISAYNSIDLGTQHLLNFSDTPLVKKIAADSFQRFVYTFFPDHKDLVKSAQLKVKELGGSNFPFPSGGYTKFLTSILGWKITKSIKKLI